MAGRAVLLAFPSMPKSWQSLSDLDGRTQHVRCGQAVRRPEAPVTDPWRPVDGPIATVADPWRPLDGPIATAANPWRPQITHGYRKSPMATVSREILSPSRLLIPR